MWETWPWILLSVSWHSFQILFSKLQQKGRVMCTAPSRIPIFWQFFIFWLCCTLIKCLFFPPKHCFQVPWRWPKHWSQCPMLRITFVCQHCLGVVFSLPLLTAISPWESPLHRVVIAITYASCPSLISCSSLRSHSLKSFLKWRYIWLGHLND